MPKPLGQHPQDYPWSVEQQAELDLEEQGYVWAIRVDDPENYHQNPAYARDKQTARQIAAFPDLLAALELIDAGYRLAEKSTPANLRRTILDARAVIAKARGE